MSNVIHALQDTVERQAEVIAALMDTIQSLRDYARSDKYAAPMSTMNPEDVVVRIDQWMIRVRDIESYGRAVVDDDREALVARYVVEALRAALPVAKRHGGVAGVYRQHASHVRIEHADGTRNVVDTDLQDAYGIDKEIALGDALCKIQAKNFAFNPA